MTHHLILSSPQGERSTLRFAPRCVGCATPTETTLTLTAGHHGPVAPLRWDQPIPMCLDCQRAHLRTIRQASTLRWITLLGAALAGVGATALAVRVGLSDPPALLIGVASAAPIGFIGASAVTSWVNVRQRVALHCFRDPRRDPGAVYICLRIDHDAMAADFMARNPEATPLDEWEQRAAD